MIRRIGSVLIACILVGCAAASTIPQRNLTQNARTRWVRPLELGGSLHWLSSSGLGYADAECGGGWTAITGGAYSAKATDIGQGGPGSDGSSWVVISPSTYDLVTAYVMCAPTYALSGYFYRVASRAAPKHPKAAAALCSKGSMLVGGWAYNATYEGASIVGGNPQGWAAGGTTGVVAVAECATPTEVKLDLSLVKRTGNNVFASCDGASEKGDADDVVSGFFGIATASSGTPPVEREYPAVATGAGSTAPIGFWFLDKNSSTGWVVCQED